MKSRHVIWFMALCGMTLLPFQNCSPFKTVAAGDRSGESRSSFSLQSTAVYSPSAGDIHGQVGFVSVEKGEVYLNGWACSHANPGESVAVHFYRSGEYGHGGVFLGGGPASLPVNDRFRTLVASVCVNGGLNHGFKFHMSKDLRYQFPGEPLIVYGVSGGGAVGRLAGATRIHAPNIITVPLSEGDSTAAISTAIEAALGAVARPVEIFLQAGKYNLNCRDIANDQCLKISTSLENRSTTGDRIYLGGAGADFTEINIRNPKVGFVYFGRLQGLRLFDFSVDYEIPPFTQGAIVSKGADWIVLKIQGGMPVIPDDLCASYATPNPNDLTNGGKWGAPVSSSTREIQNSPAFNASGSIILPSRCVRVSTDSWRLYISPAVASELAVGASYVQLLGSDWRRSVFSFQDNAGIRIENINVFTSPGLVSLFRTNETEITINGFNVEFRRNANGNLTERLITTLADVLHFQSDRSFLSVENCRFDGIMDNVIDIGAVGARVLSHVQNTPNSVTVKVNSQYAINSGEWVQVISRQSGRLKLIARVMTSMPQVDGLVLTLNQPDPGISGDDLIFSLTAATPGSIIRGNYFRRSRGLHMLNRSSWGRIENNIFDRPNWSAIMIAADFIWNGGPVANGVTISGNTFIGGKSTEGQIVLKSESLDPNSLEAFGPYGMKIENNRFQDPEGFAISLKNTSSTAVIGNTFINPKVAGAIHLANAHTTKMCSNLGSPVVVRDVNSWDYPLSAVTCP